MVGLSVMNNNNNCFDDKNCHGYLRYFPWQEEDEQIRDKE